MKRCALNKRFYSPIILSMLALVAAAYPAQINAQSSPPDAAMQPLADCMDQLPPTDVFKNFYRLTQVPRPSHHEEKASAFLVAFGRSLNLETIRDDAGNVIIRKPATPGYENRHGVVFQAHMDMVPQKTADKTHDFLKDPIMAYVKDGWLTADRTTLGADDGIGVAIIMALLQDKTIPHGPIEGLFTVNEEDGFGVSALKPGVLKGDYLINIDWEGEGTFAIGSAGGVNVDALGRYAQESTPPDMRGYRIEVKGLAGGHSGMDINKGGGSACKLLARLLWSADAYKLRVASITAGDRYNAIPREAIALVAVPKTQGAAFEKYVGSFESVVKNELAATEPALSIRASAADRPAKVMHAKSQAMMLSAIYGSINGVQRMSDSLPGLVESSSNLGIFTVDNGQWKAGILVRSAVDSARDDTAGKLAAVLRLAGADVKTHDAYSGWRPDTKSPLLTLMKGTYFQQYGKEVGLVAVHAGLETSVIGVKYPKMDMVSLGPTLQNVHSPDEQLEIATVAKVYDLLTATLQRIPVK